MVVLGTVTKSAPCLRLVPGYGSAFRPSLGVAPASLWLKVAPAPAFLRR